MREIKFRGKRLDNGEWIYGDLYHTNELTCICDWSIKPHTVENFAVDPATVGQYWRTIKDKHLFDGDIFRFKNGDGYIVRLVRYSEEQAAFCIINPAHLKRDKWMGIEQIPEATWWRHVVNEIEIIGNIHDNPKLLKSE